jgi:hypothetical protein
VGIETEFEPALVAEADGGLSELDVDASVAGEFEALIKEEETPATRLIDAEVDGMPVDDPPERLLEGVVVDVGKVKSDRLILPVLRIFVKELEWEVDPDVKAVVDDKVDEDGDEEPAKDPVEPVVELEIDVDNEGDIVVPLFKLVVARDADVIPTVRLVEINDGEEGLVLPFPEFETGEGDGGNEELMLPVVSPVASWVSIAALELDIETADERREFPLVALTLGNEGEPVVVFVLDLGEVDELKMEMYCKDVVGSEIPLFAVTESDDTPLFVVVEIVETRPILDAAPD